MDIPETTPPEDPWWRLMRRLRIVAITLFVCWHLFFLLFRNVFDLWETELVENGLKKIAWWYHPIAVVPWAETPAPDATDEEIEEARNAKVEIHAHWIFRKFDNITYRYGHFFGLEQGWSMFTPPLARSAPFIVADLVMTDDSTARVPSPNLPDVEQRAGVTSGYIRLGGWRQRKLEDQLVNENPETVGGKSDPQLFPAYVRWCIRRWKEKNTDDPREVKQVNLVRLRIYFPEPKPNVDLMSFLKEEYPIGSFTPHGVIIKP